MAGCRHGRIPCCPARPADHSEKETIETKLLNENKKQQEGTADLLRKEGFDANTARQLAEQFPREVIARQIEWLPTRSIARSRAGLLRRAIEGDWPQRASATQDSGEPRSWQPERLPPAYIAWLAGQERAYRADAPSEYGRFVAKRERRRDDLLAERSPHLREKLVARHDSETDRLTDFQRFLALPDVHQWAETINSEPLFPRT